MNEVAKLGKEADVIIPEFSRTFNFLPSAEEIKKETETAYECLLTFISKDENNKISVYDAIKIIKNGGI